MLRSYLATLALVAALVAPATVAAAGVDVSIGAADITLSPALSSYPAGTAVRVYVRIHNGGQEDAVASAQLTSGGVAIGQASPVPVRAGGNAETWVDWIVPSQPFRIAAAVTAAGDGQQRNNSAETDEYQVSAPTERDIFSPPPGREGATASSTPLATSTLESSTTAPTTTEQEPYAAAPVSFTQPPAPEQRQAPLDDYAWIPYVLIALGAIGFAWGMRGRRRAAPRPAPAARPTRRRVAKVYRPAVVVEKPAPKRRRAAPRRKPAAPPPEEPTV